MAEGSLAELSYVSCETCSSRVPRFMLECWHALEGEASVSDIVLLQVYDIIRTKDSQLDA